MKKFCESLRERTMKFTKFGKKKIIPLTKEEYESYLPKQTVTFAKKSWKINTLIIKNIVEL